ncbi:MAG: hypothetical protein AAGJ82_10595, partial [Bacteroidota bacterium]
IPRQRKLLCDLVQRRPDPALDEHWDFLDHTAVDSDTAVVGSQLYQSFRNGDYRLEDIPRVGMGRLRDYFRAIVDDQHTGPPATERQRAEYAILKSFFNIEEDFYMSLPLVLFGEFDGILHFIYSAEDAKRLGSRTPAGLIRSASGMIETQILEWDLVGRNPEKSKAIMMPMEQSFYENVNRNPILQQLEFQEYYRKYFGFYQKRIRFNDDIIHSKVHRPYLKAAITSIMIDSFAHNVSAHSLVALNWWFKQRAENLRQSQRQHRQEATETKEIIATYVPEGYDQDRITDLLAPWIKGMFVRNADPEYDLVNFPGPLAREIQPLLKYLMQKGAFWSGIARDNHFGGESASAFDVLWGDFINNPLYLGTIAKSEAIHKIRFRIIFHAAEYDPTEADGLLRKPAVTDGIFVEVDLKNRRSPLTQNAEGVEVYRYADGRELPTRTYPELLEMSDFVAPGSAYEEVKKALQNCRLFFPGEVVGRHAFFTLIENKIRNVKHFKDEVLQDMQENGLELCLSFQERRVHHTLDTFALYRVGIWLTGAVPLFMKNGQSITHVRKAGLERGIMDESTFAPRLGGSSQDKLCASMLFNNFFLRVQHGDQNELRDQTEDTARDRLYYPWIIPAAGPVDDFHADLDSNLSPEVYQQLVGQHCQAGKGVLKKYFHIWKAADIHELKSGNAVDLTWDNLARFKFVAITPENSAAANRLRDEVRTQGVLRVIDQHLSPATTDNYAAIHAAYQVWLRSWAGKLSSTIQLMIDNAIIGQFVYRPASEQVLRYEPVWELDSQVKSGTHVTQQLHIAHGGDSEDVRLLRYRNHGVYASYFRAALTPNQPLSTKAKARMAEFFEVLITRISIFDSRVFHRLGSSSRRQTLSDQLLLHVYDEASENAAGQNWLSEWEAKKEWVIKQSHFLVLHLSFIEKILVTKYADHPTYGEENVGLFIQKEIIPYALGTNGKVRDNFTLVITTGRGRTKWWTRLVDEVDYQPFQRFTYFRPVESIISAIEDAISRKDDLAIKYNLVKVMFGS